MTWCRGVKLYLYDAQVKPIHFENYDFTNFIHMVHILWELWFHQLSTQSNYEINTQKYFPKPFGLPREIFKKNSKPHSVPPPKTKPINWKSKIWEFYLPKNEFFLFGYRENAKKIHFLASLVPGPDPPASV